MGNVGTPLGSEVELGRQRVSVALCLSGNKMTQEANAGSPKAPGILKKRLGPPSRSLGNWPDTDLGPTREGADVGQVGEKGRLSGCQMLVPTDKLDAWAVLLPGERTRGRSARLAVDGLASTDCCRTASISTNLHCLAERKLALLPF